VGALQLELYPSATKADRQGAKALLRKYRKNKAIVNEFDKIGADKLAPDKRIIYNTALKRVNDVERAVRLILDPEIRDMIEHKYIRGDIRRHKDTVSRFSLWDQSTVGRKLNEGIESVAESIKLFEC